MNLTVFDQEDLANLVAEPEEEGDEEEEEEEDQSDMIESPADLVQTRKNVRVKWLFFCVCVCVC